MLAKRACGVERGVLELAEVFVEAIETTLPEAAVLLVRVGGVPECLGGRG